MTLLRVPSPVALIVAFCLGQPSAATAQNADIIGRWIIAKAQLAPWADPLQRGGPEEERRLVGRKITFAPHSVTGPAPLGCARATYSAHNDTAALLFEGSLAEPARNGTPQLLDRHEHLGPIAVTHRDLPSRLGRAAPTLPRSAPS